MMDTAIAAYAAGILDGEGFVGIVHQVKTYNPRVDITNTNFEVMEWLVGNFGNHYAKREKPGHQDIYIWCLSSFDDVKRFLTVVEPFVVIKKRQVGLVLDFINLGKMINGKGSMDELLNYGRADLYWELRQLASKRRSKVI